MNEANLINQNSRLFGFLAENAQQNRFSVTLNRLFKDKGEDAMIIPMNIREDDFYFTVSGLRKAQLSGVMIGDEYRREVLELLDSQSEAVSECGFCDIVRVSEGKLHGDIAIAGAVVALLRERGVETLAILGSGALAKSVMTALQGSGVNKVVLFNDRVESCMMLMEQLSLDGLEVDIERAAPDMAVDFSRFDAALNASPLGGSGDLPNILAAKLMIEPGQEQACFKGAATGDYIGHEELLPYYAQRAYEFWIGE